MVMKMPVYFDSFCLLELLWALVITPSVFMYLNSISVEVLFLWK